MKLASAAMFILSFLYISYANAEIPTSPPPSNGYNALITKPPTATKPGPTESKAAIDQNGNLKLVPKSAVPVVTAKPIMSPPPAPPSSVSNDSTIVKLPSNTK